MAKTIKEIADELGVSKTAVSKQIAKPWFAIKFAKKRKPVLRSKTNKKS